MKTTSFLLTSSMVLAMALTFSCSSGGDEGGSNSVDAFGLPTQVYMDGSEYRGNGDIITVLDSDTLFVGKIQNGKTVLNLPENIDSKYLKNMNEYDSCNNSSYKSCEDNTSFTNDLYTSYAPLNVIIPGKQCHYLRLHSAENSTKAEAEFAYFSKVGKMEGTVTYIYRDEYSERDINTTVTYNVDVLKGLKIIWTVITGTENSMNLSMSTNATQSVKNSVKWQASCRNVD